MSNNIFMLNHYGDNIFPETNSSVIYNDRSCLLLPGNLGTSNVEMKEIICHGFG
jgi:hypothetical protein